MSKLNFSTVENADQVSTGKQIMRPGIHENVTVTGVADTVTPNGKAEITISFMAEDGVTTFDAKCSMEGGAVPYTLRKIKHLLTKYATEEDANKMDTVDKINAFLTGKKYRMKFNGEEYVNKEGVIRIKTSLGLPNFAENMKTAKSESRLTFSESNEYDIKRITTEAAGLAAPMGNVANVNDSLPF